MDRLIEPSFIELAKIMEDHTTLIKLDCSIKRYSPGTKTAMLLEALKDNRSIKHLSLNCDEFDSNTAHAFAQTLMNNQTWHTLNLSVYSSSASRFGEPEPIEIGAVIKFAPALQTTALQRLTVGEFKNEDFKALVEYLPKTLVYLNLERGLLMENSIPILRSYLESNGSTLKTLFLNTYYIESYLEQEELLLFRKIKSLSHHSWKAEFLDKKESYHVQLRSMSDSDWSDLFMKLTKDDTISREIHLDQYSEFDRNQLNYIKTLLDNQFRLTSLIITGNCSDTSIQIDLLRYLKENNTITELELCFKMDSSSFNELTSLLTSKNNIIRLNLTDNSCINDEQAIMLAQILKNNTGLQSLVLINTTIGDIGFQELISSLPSSLFQLRVNNSRISSKSLPFLLDFIKAHPFLKYISLKTNGISNAIDVNVPDLIEKILQITNTNHCLLDLDINEKVKQAMLNLTDDCIGLGNEDLRDDHILELCNQLKKMSNRNWALYLQCNNQISSVGYRYLSDILSSTITITNLCVANSGMNEEARASLLNNLWKNKTLKTFDISSNKLNNQDMEYIGRFIQNNSVVEEIDLNMCEIDDDGAICLAKFLAESSLKKLDLTRNSVSDRGCASLLSSIPLTLIDLLLGYNKISESSLQTILNFLTDNRTLRKLTLGNNPICFKEGASNEYNDAVWQQLRQTSKQNNICELD
ncbi:unnamed protein product [Rotaria sp. Silwood2]|nr:unnamed protein product [Rotaria sp. Silwood2]